MSEDNKQGDFKVDGKERLKALYRYNILDSDFDSRFDDHVELGALLYNAKEQGRNQTVSA